MSQGGPITRGPNGFHCAHGAQSGSISVFLSFIRQEVLEGIIYLLLIVVTVSIIVFKYVVVILLIPGIWLKNTLTLRGISGLIPKFLLL